MRWNNVEMKRTEFGGVGERIPKIKLLTISWNTFLFWKFWKLVKWWPVFKMTDFGNFGGHFEPSRVFPKIDHSVRMCMNCICWKTLWNLCQIFSKSITKIWQKFHKVLVNNVEHVVNIYQIYMAKFYLNIKIYGTINDPLPSTPTCFTKCGRCITLFVLETSLPIYRRPHILASDISA